VFISGCEKRELCGWALNISRGGLRAILDEAVEVGACFEITLGDEGTRDGRVVWTREEPGGAIVGVAFVGPQEERPRAEDKASENPKRHLDGGGRS
jgi:hypothetical protein